MPEPEFGETPSPHPSGFEPPTDVNVPWYAWVIWPFGMLAALIFAGLLFRGCFSIF